MDRQYQRPNGASHRGRKGSDQNDVLQRKRLCRLCTSRYRRQRYSPHHVELSLFEGPRETCLQFHE